MLTYAQSLLRSWSAADGTAPASGTRMTYSLTGLEAMELISPISGVGPTARTCIVIPLFWALRASRAVLPSFTFEPPSVTTT